MKKRIISKRDNKTIRSIPRKLINTAFINDEKSGIWNVFLSA